MMVDRFGDKWVEYQTRGNAVEEMFIVCDNLA